MIISIGLMNSTNGAGTFIKIQRNGRTRLWPARWRNIHRVNAYVLRQIQNGRMVCRPLPDTLGWQAESVIQAEQLALPLAMESAIPFQGELALYPPAAIGESGL